MRTIDQTVEQLYASISFSKNNKPNFILFKELFIHGAKLINNNDEQPQIFNVDSFIESFKENLVKGIFASVFEVEIAHKTDIFGKIAQRFSTYEFRFDPNDDVPYSVGINAIQLIEVGSVWTIVSMVWNDQKPGLEIPETYLLM